MLALTASALARCNLAQVVAHAGGTDDQQTYYEFGTVVALGQRSVEVHSYDQAKKKVVRHSFALSSDTRADLVHVGEVVEVIYTSNAGQLTARRLVSLSAGVPKAGDAARCEPRNRTEVGLKDHTAGRGSCGNPH